MANICQKMNTAGANLQSRLNERGVACTYGKTTEGKQDINDMADLITSSNLKGSADYLITLSANMPYLMSGEKTDLIVKLVNGLGVPQANKTVTVSVEDFEFDFRAKIFDNANWNTNPVAVFGQINAGNETYMTSEFCGVYHYTLDMPIEWYAGTIFDFSIGSSTSNTGDKIGIRYDGDDTITTYKKVNNVETVLKTQDIGELDGNSLLVHIVREGNTITLNGESVTSSSLYNTFYVKGLSIYDDDYSGLGASSLYTGITNNEGVLTLYDVSVSANTTFLASYSTFSGSIVIESSDMIDYGVTNNNNFTDWNNASSRLTVTVTSNGKLLESSTNGYGYYITKNYKYTDYIVEFDVVSLTELVAWYCRASSSDVQIVGNLYTIGVRNGDHVKIQVEDNYLNLWTNDVKKTNSPIQITPNGPCDVGFRFTNQTGKNITFKNFRIQEL